MSMQVTPVRTTLTGTTVLMACACGAGASSAKLLQMGGVDATAKVTHPIFLGIGALLILGGMWKIERRAAFLNGYMAKYNLKTVPASIPAAQAYDSIYLLLYSLFGVRDASISGPAIKASLENLDKVYHGAVATYDHPFSTNDKDAFTSNMLLLGQVKGGVVTYAYPADIRRNVFAQRKQ